MAFIHPVKPFENSILMLGRNADTGIADNQTIILGMDRHAAAGNIILNGIVAEVINGLLEHSADTFDGKAITSYIDLHILLRSTGCQNFLHILSKL